MVGPAKILVVDDDPDTVVYLSSLLEDHGYLVEGASDADDALELLEHFAPDAMLLDVVMPGRSGMDLLVTIRSDERWAELPLAIVTGHDELLADQGRSYMSSHPGLRGPDAVVGKPIVRDQLLAMLTRMTQGS